MTLKVHGVSMHYYDDRVNSDKFYRCFYWQDDTGWWLARVWGRDGARGQIKLHRYRTGELAEDGMHQVMREKLGKGYQLLGEGNVSVDMNPIQRLDVYVVADKLHAWVGRDPIKLPSDYVFVIQEEDDILDLIA